MHKEITVVFPALTHLAEGFKVFYSASPKGHIPHNRVRGDVGVIQQEPLEGNPVVHVGMGVEGRRRLTAGAIQFYPYGQGVGVALQLVQEHAVTAARL